MNAAANTLLPFSQRFEAFLQPVEACPNGPGRFPGNLPAAFDDLHAEFYFFHFEKAET